MSGTTARVSAGSALARLWPWWPEVDGATLRADALAGLLGAVLVLPQAIAFAALAGMPPSVGLAAAVLPGAVAALAGSSRHVATGPTNATALALGAMLASLPAAAASPAHAVALALALTLLAGLMQAALAVSRLGGVANFISPSVMLGFTSGAAMLIAWYALAGLIGAEGRVAPPAALAAGVSLPALSIGLATLAAAAAGRRWWRRGPYLLAALALSIALAWLAARAGAADAFAAAAARLGAPFVATPAKVLGAAPSAWPQPRWPLDPALRPASWREAAALLRELLPMALALAIVALGQAMAIAKALAARSGQALDVNRECLGQGLANVASACVGGMVVCGSLNRSLPNYEAGARTPLASALSALWLVALVALAAPALAWLPAAGIAALLLVVAWALIDQAGWRRVWRLDRREFAVAAATAAATLALRLEIAVLAGVVLSLVVYLWRSSHPALRSMGFDRAGGGAAGAARPFVVVDGAPPGALPECPQLKMLRMEGSVWFGAVPHVAEHLRELRAEFPRQRHLLVMAKSMNRLDLAGADLWDDELARRRAAGGDLYFHRPRPPVLDAWTRSGFLSRLGPGNVFADKRRAIAAIVPRLDPAVCAGCTVRLYDECAERPGAPAMPVI